MTQMHCMRRALAVGIDDYPSAPLRGCVNDAEAIAALLERNDDGSPNFAVRLRTSNTDTITRASLRASIEQLFQDEAEVALLYFSGHGTENDLDGYIVTPDARTYEEGISLTQVLTLANKSRADEVVIFLDCCQSGALGNIPAAGNKLANIREGVSILTASRSTQYALEIDGVGLFTSLVCAALDGGAADVLGRVTAAAIYSYVDESLGPWDQRPLFKSHVSRLLPLRYAQPGVDLVTLRQLPTWFPTPDTEFPLDPSFEPDAEPIHPEHQAIFGQLQKCRAAKLIEPVGEEHMYFAAMRSKGCRLTPLGRHYWRQARDGRI